MYGSLLCLLSRLLGLVFRVGPGVLNLAFFRRCALEVMVCKIQGDPSIPFFST